MAVIIEHPSYTVAEDAGTLDFVVVARARTGITSVEAFFMTLSSDAQTALSGLGSGDFRPLSETLSFASSDFQVEHGALVARKTVSVTIYDDDVYEGDEYFHLHPARSAGSSPREAFLDTEGEPCGSECPNPYVVKITDDEPAVTVSFGQAAYSVAEGGSLDITVTLSDDPQRTVVIPITVDEQDGATGDDYSGVPQSVTFNAGETSRTIPFAATYDTIDDDGESVLICICSDLPPGVSEGANKETVVTIANRKFIAETERPGISVPKCESNGISIFWHSGIEFQDDPPPYGWRVERRHFSDEEWVTSRFDFLGAASDALQTFSDEYWDWTDTTRRLGVDYTYRVHPLDENAQLMEGRNWSRRAPALCR